MALEDLDLKKEEMKNNFKKWEAAQAQQMSELDPDLQKGQRHGLWEAEHIKESFHASSEDLKPFKPIEVKDADTEGKLSFSEIEVTKSPAELPNYSSHKRAQEAKQEALWQSMSEVSLIGEIQKWLDGLKNEKTKRVYYISMSELIKHGFINPAWSLQQFSLLSPDLIVDKIKTSNVVAEDGKSWSMSTIQARIACFIAFTRDLSRKTEGICRRAIPCREGTMATFSQKLKKVKTPALSRSQLLSFFTELEAINTRDAILAKICLQGAKRISEVLSLEAQQIDFENRQIKFHQAKSKFEDDCTIISFEQGGAADLFDQLKTYIGERTGPVFITANGKPIRQNQIDRNFALAGTRAKLPFRMSPHILRATAITLWKQDGFSDSDIMKASGHASAEMVHKYDKSDIANNVTKKSSLL